MNSVRRETMPEAAVQKFIDDQAASLYPEWRHGMTFRPHALLLRRDVSAECLGLVGPRAADPRYDLRLGGGRPGGERGVRALGPRHRIDASRPGARTSGGSGARRCRPRRPGAALLRPRWIVICSPIIMRMGRGDEPAVVDYLRRDLRRLYGEHAETVLMFMLRTYRHGGTERLIEAARATAVAA